MRRLSILLFGLCSFLCTSCTSSPDNSRINRQFTGDFGAPLQIQFDNHVRRQPPALSVTPQVKASHHPKAVFLPLRMTQQMSGAVSFSNNISRQFWNIWISLSMFHTLEFCETPIPYSPAMAIDIGRRKGAELAIGGYIHHYIDGGSGGTSSMSLAVEVYDVRSGVLLWSMAQGGMMESRQVHDFYLFSVKERNPGDPAGLICRSLAWDMGLVLLNWIDPGQARKLNRGSSATKTFFEGEGF
ncbi:MAG: hypothetical protein K5657_05060 [Desulfovibrio sp.]|nr:hypothetical protein [Desulfovibrio sp.]